MVPVEEVDSQGKLFDVDDACTSACFGEENFHKKDYL